METILRDVRYTIRSLLKTPSFTIVALLALAMGIGANTAVFSVIKAAILKPLPYTEVEKLLTANGVAVPLYLQWKNASQSLDLEAHSDREFNVSGQASQPESVIGVYVSRGYLSLLGVRPLIGRLFSDEEFEPGREQVALIGSNLWRRRFNEDRSVIGRPVALNGTNYTIVGILPVGSEFSRGSRRPRDTEIWAPLLLSPPNHEPDGSGKFYVGP